MSKTRVHNFVVSLDGYASGVDQSLERAFGDAQDTFIQWFRRQHVFRGAQPGATLGPDEAIAAAWGPGIGADIMGRNIFRPTSGPWPDDGWRGWWGEDPPFHTPCFIWTHYPRPPIVMEGGTVFHFVSGSPSEVLALAKEAAGDQDVRIGGGPTTVNRFLAADLVDHLHIILIPVVLGDGVPLWAGLGGLQERFAVDTLSVPSGATHLFFTRHEQ